MIDFNKAPIKYTVHASSRLKERFQMKTDEVRHYLKTGKHIKKTNKDGEVGMIQSEIGDSRIRFVYTVRSGTIYILTIEE
ncbi:MAG: DUF4258 domain-containing protein [Euryarchaeota archaeon]|nr:DUF4258 domain-containing protein [Euryarchaeota archaeon]MBU4138612.1 DUF4258 domain-containing protein [Euryarchaeota archaeon]